jgi:poly-gamma-glutamate capsule biosynthesis protein CapA/YwtB (metallophosphatase superfamily)
MNHGKQLAPSLPGETATAPERLRLAAVGDCLIGRRVSTLRDPGFLDLVKLLRGADCTWGNCEVVFVDSQNVCKTHKVIDPHVRCETWGADELRFMGINLMGTANNHTMDFGDEGLLSTLESLDRVGIAHAGAGLDLDRASRPAYCETTAGRIALVDCASSFFEHYAAGPPEPVFRGRPGLNPLLIQYTVQVDRSLFAKLDEVQTTIQRLLGWHEFADVIKEMKDMGPADTGLFLETPIKAGETLDVLTQPRPEDVSRVLRAIEMARQEARVVIASVHAHGARRRMEEPDSFLPPFARACLDAGANVVLATGPHVMRGIDLYRGKPIFYSLGNFFSHPQAVAKPPADGSQSPRSRRAKKNGLQHQRRFWESFVPRITFAAGGEVTAIELHPITLGFGKRESARGTPRLARGEEARAILLRLAELSRSYGTNIDIDGEVGRVRLGAVPEAVPLPLRDLGQADLRESPPPS